MTQKITAIFGIAVLAAILLGGLTLSQSAFAGGPSDAGKVTICHNGDDGPETITVSGNAVQKHIDKHGDTVGECVDEPATCVECEENATSAFNACLVAGGSDGQCFVEIEPSFSECSLTCEGTEDEKTAACGSAAFIQLLSCGIKGELTEEQCLENATAFFEECAGFSPPPDA